MGLLKDKALPCKNSPPQESASEISVLVCGGTRNLDQMMALVILK